MSDDLSSGLLKKIKIEAEYFNLPGLKTQVELALRPKPDDVLMINCRGTVVRTTRRVVQWGRENPESFDYYLAEMIDPASEKYIQPESDGSIKLDIHHGFIKWLLTDVEDDEGGFHDFCVKYGTNNMNQSRIKFQNEFC